MTASRVAALAGVAAVVGAGGFLLIRQGMAPAPATADQIVARARADKRDPAGSLGSFVEQNEASPSPKVQDEVTRARIHMAYLTADKKDYAEARQVLLKAESEYKGSGKMSASYGTLADQAAYQAIVCLAAEGKKDEARKEFRAFIQKRQESPLVHACYRRLVRLNGGKSDPADEALLQKAVTAQEKKARFEMSVCGPKAIAHLAKASRLIEPAPGYAEIARRCGTTDDGTSLRGMISGLRSYGLRATAVRLNRKDFEKVKPPAIWLRDRHYFVLNNVADRAASVYDPTSDAQAFVPLPPREDTDFTADVLVFDADRLLGKNHAAR